MKNYQKLLVLITLTLSSCALFQPKDIGRNTVADLSNDIEKLTSEERINGIVKSAVEGALEGTSSERSAESIKDLVQILTKEIKDQINPVLDSLDTKVPAEKLVNGAIEALTSEKNKAKIDSLITNILRNADENLAITVSDLEKSINKTLSSIVSNLKHELAGMDKTIAEMFSDVLQDSLSSLINGTIAGIDMEMISKRISTELLTKQLRDTISLMLKDASESATKPLDSILGLLKKNLIYVALVIAGLVLLLWWIRRKFVKKDHDAKHAQEFASEMTKAIANISSKHENLDLEKKIKERLADKKTYDKYKET
ncbi:MAG: hypothetical protein ACI86M_004042 [Saprospiraceae bacterium]|jgi:hypothetical protein